MHFTHRLLQITAAALAVSAAACGGGSSGEWVGTIDTLPGRAQLVSNAGPGLWGADDAWTIVEDLRIGAVDGTGPDVFGEIRDFAVDHRNWIYVLDRQAADIRVFDDVGSFRYRIGRRGGGPGEFENPWGLAIAPDGKLWVIDSRNLRFSVFDTVGVLVAAPRRPHAGWSYRWPGGFGEDGIMLDYEISRGAVLRRVDVGLRPLVQGIEAERGVGLGTAPAQWRDDGFAQLQTIDSVPLPQYDGPEEVSSIRFDQIGGSGRSFRTMPFTARLVWTFDPAGFLWFASTKAYRVYQRTLAGDTVGVIELERAAQPVSPGDRDSVLNLVADMRAEGYRTDFEPSDIPEARPFFENIHVDDEGRLWLLRETDAKSTRYDVFDTDGRYLGAVLAPFSVPTYATVVIKGDAFYARTLDELDVPYVVRGRIHR